MNDQAYNAAYYERHAEQLRAAARMRYAKLTPKEKTARREREYELRRQNPTRLTKQRAATARRRAELLAGYGGCCACCGTDYLPHLTLDHVNGGGTQQRKREDSRVTHARLWRLLQEGALDPAFQLLCWNCNWAKHHLGRCECQD